MLHAFPATAVIERAAPHRVVRWAWATPPSTDPRAKLGGSDAGELTGTARLPYWSVHNPGDESYLASLGFDGLLPHHSGDSARRIALIEGRSSGR